MPLKPVVKKQSLHRESLPLRLNWIVPMTKGQQLAVSFTYHPGLDDTDVVSASIDQAISKETMKETKEMMKETKESIKTYIKDVVEYIGLNYKSDITTPDLAARFFVSVNKLNRDFKRYTGSTIKQYLIALRMKYARAMLSRGEGVRKTAEDCGFESLSYFIQAFRQYTGQTPSAFSKKALGKFDYFT